jgi:Ca2+-transporting ATPase
MGISGCEVAKEAADIIILDDNFTSIFRAAQWGRSIYDNIRKFIQFQFTVNIVAVSLVFISGATLGSSPLNVIQLLWINMVMDTLAAIALATEPPHPTELKKERVRRHDKIFTPVMYRNIFGQAIYQFLVVIILLYFAPLMFDIRYDYIYDEAYFVNGNPTNRLYHYTLIFHTFMLMQLFNQFNSRNISLRDINIFERFFNNFTFIIVITLEFLVQWAIVEFGGVIFRTTPLTWRMNLTATCLGFGTILVGLALKQIPEEQVNKVAEKLAFNENQGDEGEDYFSTMQRRMQGKIKKTEAEKLLDSY